MELESFAVAADEGGVGGSTGGGADTGEMERLWRYADVARYLGMSIAWVRRMVTMRRIAGVRKFGRATRFVPSEIKRWALSRPGGN